ncbi:unnamed protein product [Linum trigynum]|uniref:Uncharacterized protein n=1 Tax=Linum trigynum TaxID=586398 RepID=A0AAV2GNF5_9ROSI
MVSLEKTGDLALKAKALEAIELLEEIPPPPTTDLPLPPSTDVLVQPPSHKSATVAAATRPGLMEELTLALVPRLIEKEDDKAMSLVAAVVARPADVGEGVNPTATSPLTSKLRAGVAVKKLFASKPRKSLINLQVTPPVAVDDACTAAVGTSLLGLLQPNWKSRKKLKEDGVKNHDVMGSPGMVRGCIGPSMGGLVGRLLYGFDLETSCNGDLSVELANCASPIIVAQAREHGREIQAAETRASEADGRVIYTKRIRCVWV